MNESLPLLRDTQIYRTADGQALSLDVIGARPGERRPAMLWIHGGGLIFGSRTTSPRPAFLQLLLERGFVVFSIDHRLAPETKLPAIFDDVLQAWRWLHGAGVQHFGADPDRTVIGGASAGAYLALLAANRATPRPRAVASFWGYGDILAPWETQPSPHYLKLEHVSREAAAASLAAPPLQAPTTGSDRSTFYLYCRQQGCWVPEVTGLDIRLDAAELERWCPLRLQGTDSPPVVLVHGQEDTDVPHEQSALLAAELARAGVRHRFLSLPGTGHGFAGAHPEEAAAAEREVANFLLAQVRQAVPAGTRV